MRKFLIAFMAMLLSVSLAACSTTSASTSSDTNSTTSTDLVDTSDTDEAAIMEEVINRLKDYSGTPSFYPEEFGAVDISVLAGKKVMLIAYDATNDWCVNYVLMAQEVLTKVGAEPFITYCDGSADSWISAIQSAINQEYDAVDLFGISDIGVLGSVIDEAKAAGIYIQDTHGTDISDTSSNSTVSVGCDYNKAGELMALQAIEMVGSVETLNCLVIADVGWGADTNVREGITGVFDEYNAQYTIADVAITDWTEGIGNAVRNSFIADDSYNAIIAFYDNMCLYVVPALEELAVDLDSVYIGSFNGNPGLIDYVASGNIDFDLGESIGWCAAHAVDCMGRYFADQEVHNDSGFPMYFITTENVEGYLAPDTGKASYGYDGVQDVYLSGYSQLWGIDLTGVFDNLS